MSQYIFYSISKFYKNILITYAFIFIGMMIAFYYNMSVYQDKILDTFVNDLQHINKQMEHKLLINKKHPLLFKSILDSRS